MKRKKKTFGPRPFSGYVDYRYGRSAQMTLAPIFKGERRKHILDRVLGLIRDWRRSPFEHEASVHHGLRSALCIDGHGFARSEQEAATLVSEGLRLIGAKRPTWQEGQRNHVDDEDKCRWCSRTLPPEASTGNRRHIYCSDVCGKAAFEHMVFQDKRTTNRVYVGAFRAARRMGTPPRRCEHCGKAFHPFSDDDGQRFCSRSCAAAFSRTLPEIACLTCGKPTRSDVSYRDRKYCSLACYGARPKEPRFDRTCLLCGKHFVAVTDRALFCSEEHANRDRRIRAMIRRNEASGRRMSLSTDVFDHVFRAVA